MVKKKMLSKSELLREGYVKGLKRALTLIEKMIDLKLANNILLESFKDDVLNGYKKLGYNTQDKKLLTAISTFNTENLIKELVKRLVGKVPNVGLAVTKKYTPEEFINFVSKALQNINIKQLQQREKELRKQKASSTSDKYFIYPCRTFEEAHEAAFSHTGNLKKLSREEREKFFKDEYGINIPKPQTHFETDMTPKQMIEFMKECSVFMEPTWCVCADKNSWNTYNLQAEKNEDANCFVVISKTHPNVRFCITRNVNVTKKVEDDYIILKKVSELGEFRDIWQIGGRDVQETGIKMAKLAFGDISNILNNISKEKYEKTPFDEITNGNRLFDNNKSLTFFNKKLTSLIKGFDMFRECCNLISFTSKLPNLTNGCAMFLDCRNLKSFTSELPSLTNGSSMFEGCSKLSSFRTELHKLNRGSYMFRKCRNLKSFTSELPSLTDGKEMFSGCKLDKPSVLNILTSVPRCKSTIHIGVGYDYTKDEDTLQAIEEAKNKGWNVIVKTRNYPRNKKF